MKDMARDRHSNPADVSAGADKALNVFNEGWSEGFTGLYTRPQQAKEEDDSAKNVGKGVVSGIASVIAKPIAGTAAATANALKGVGKAADPNSGWSAHRHVKTVTRVRPQRALPAGVVVPYIPNPSATKAPGPRNREQEELGTKPKQETGNKSDDKKEKS